MTVKIGINTGLAHLSGNREEDELLSAYDVHKKLLYTIKQNGWADKPLTITDTNVGKIDVKLGEGMSL